jgi:proline iminopeptidase
VRAQTSANFLPQSALQRPEGSAAPPLRWVGGHLLADTYTREVRGARLFERRAGSGPPTVVLHGGPGAHHDYLLPGFDELARGRELIYYDQRGGGRSPVSRETSVGWTEQVADLEELRRQWGLERLTIAGYSWGGLLALLYAVEFPTRVDRLALVSPAPAWREARVEFERRFQERNLAPALQRERAAQRESGLQERDPAGYAQRLFELSVAPYFFDPARARELTPFRVTGRTQQEVWASLGEYDLRPDLTRLSIPSLVLQGEDDVIPVEASRTVARLLGADFHLLPHCGHVPYVEALPEFVALLDGFLPAAG